MYNAKFFPVVPVSIDWAMNGGVGDSAHRRLHRVKFYGSTWQKRTMASQPSRAQDLLPSLRQSVPTSPRSLRKHSKNYNP